MIQKNKSHIAYNCNKWSFGGFLYVMFEYVPIFTHQKKQRSHIWNMGSTIAIVVLSRFLIWYPDPTQTWNMLKRQTTWGCVKTCHLWVYWVYWFTGAGCCSTTLYAWTFWKIRIFGPHVFFFFPSVALRSVLQRNSSRWSSLTAMSNLNSFSKERLKKTERSQGDSAHKKFQTVSFWTRKNLQILILSHCFVPRSGFSIETSHKLRPMSLVTDGCSLFTYSKWGCSRSSRDSKAPNQRSNWWLSRLRKPGCKKIIWWYCAWNLRLKQPLFVESWGRSLFYRTNRSKCPKKVWLKGPFPRSQLEEPSMLKLGIPPFQLPFQQTLTNTAMFGVHTSIGPMILGGKCQHLE